MATIEANVRAGPQRGVVEEEERLREPEEPTLAPRFVHERVALLFDAVDRLAQDWPAAALAALREILSLEPGLSRAQDLYHRLRREESPPTTAIGTALRPADSARKADFWIDEAEFFIAQDLWGDAYESLREAAAATPPDPRVSDWLAFVEAERRGRDGKASGGNGNGSGSANGGSHGAPGNGGSR